MTAPAPPTPTPPADEFTDEDLAGLQALLDALPAPLEPLDVSALDGYLCGVLLQPRPPAPEQWLRYVTDMEGRPAPPGVDTGPLLAIAQRRHAQLARAIARRDWFDPWVYQLDEDASPSDCVLPWVAGFAVAMEAFPALMERDDPELVEPLALIYQHFAPEDLEDAEALLEVIETLEPPEDLDGAVQDLVRSLMLMADVVAPAGPGGARPTARARRPGNGRGSSPARGGRRR